MNKITVVTVCFNCVELIEGTILSVFKQDYQNIQYIIVDGGSTDGTTEMIQKYSEHISCFISEPDKGIFDAMNKGLKQANGEWVIFLNAGDNFHKTNVLSDIFFNMNYGQVAVLYGSVYTYGQIRHPKPLDFLLYGGIMACHQSIFYNRIICGSELYYKTQHKYYCDIELTRRLYIRGYKFEMLDIVVSDYLGGGFSSVVSWGARLAKFDYLYDHFGFKGILYGMFSKIVYIIERFGK